MMRQPASHLAREKDAVDVNDLDGLGDYLTKFGFDLESLSSSPLVRGANQLGSKTDVVHLCIGLPDGFSNKSTFVADRLYWFPNGVPGSTSVFVTSSRLKQELENLPAWFDALRTFACRVDSNCFLITAEKISTDPFVKRIGELFRIPVCEFRPLQSHKSLQDMKERAEDEIVCYFSPRPGLKRDNQQGDLDRLLMLAAEQVLLLSVRGNGNTYRAAIERIALNSETRVLVDHNLTPKRKLNSLLKQGATGWWIYPGDQQHLDSSDEIKLTASVLGIDEINTDQYLLHWTRRCVGKWPDQSENQYLDDLIFGSSRAQHDPLAALCRILASDRILASVEMTREQTPVVCLSEITVDQLSERRVFRPHLARWDCLPFGIAIEREILQASGAKKVIYGDEATWTSLDSDSRPYFQPATSDSGKIDWQLEQEWRIVGDLDLRLIGNQQAFVFVPSMEAAEVVSTLSRWPIVVLKDGA